MKWKTALGAGVALLLLLPLALILRSSLHPPPHEGQRIVPMLDTATRRRMATYGHGCVLDSECEAPLRCMLDTRTWRSFCADSECASDSECGDGHVCRTAVTHDEGPLMRLCVLSGARQEGERCAFLPRQVEEACAQGLLCGGHQGWCGRPCRKDVLDACPSGFFCADTVPEPLCLPTCDARGCAPGHECLRFEEGVSACLQVHGINCQQTACPASQTCRVLTHGTAPGKAWMSCVQSCGPNIPACPRGQLCFTSECAPPCDPQVPATCSPGFRCMQARPDESWRCWPEWTVAP